MKLSEVIIAIKGAGEMASGIAVTLYQAGLKRIVMFDKARPLAVRCTVSFCQVLNIQEHQVEGIKSRQVDSLEELQQAWGESSIGVCPDPEWKMLAVLQPQVLIDATIAKRNLGTSRSDAPLVIGLGPGLTAGVDAHAIVETQRGHNLGRIIHTGLALPDTGEPEAVLGHTHDRVLRAPCAGVVTPLKQIGDSIECGETVMEIESQPVKAAISGVLRGCITPGTIVPAGCKIGDIDPRGQAEYCYTVSDKARALGGAVLTEILHWWNIEH